MVSFQVDERLLDEFDQVVLSTDWLEDLHAETRRSERIRRALRATKILLQAHPVAVEKLIQIQLNQLNKSFDYVSKDELRNSLEISGFLFLLLASLREMEKGRHGGDVEESLALNFLTYAALIHEIDLKKVKQETSDAETYLRILLDSRK